MAKKIVAKTLIYAILIFLVILTLVPFYLIMVNATHSSFEIVTQLNVFPLINAISYKLHHTI